jgi:hypothetical protein
MKIDLVSRALGVALAVAVLAGCGGSQPSLATGGTMPLSGVAVTVPHYVQRAAHTDHGRSWIRPDKKHGALLYVADWDTNDVYVYDLPDGKAVGTLTGFQEPYGMCVDAKGDIYITNFGNGTLTEYAHGASEPINTYDPGGELIGCSVDAKGDVSATSFSPAEVTVYAGGNPKDGTTYSNSDCEYSWTMGYDDKGNLIGMAESDSIEVCALLAGQHSETILTESGITIDFPGGTSWDGKYIALGDQEAGGSYETGVWPSTLSGTTITAATGEVKFADDCYSDYSDIVNPFFLGKGFTPVTPGTHRRAKYMIGTNVWCTDGDKPGVSIWYYPSGKLYKNVKLGSGSGPQDPYGAGVSVSP